MDAVSDCSRSLQVVLEMPLQIDLGSKVGIFSPKFADNLQRFVVAETIFIVNMADYLFRH